MGGIECIGTTAGVRGAMSPSLRSRYRGPRAGRTEKSDLNSEEGA